MTLVTFKEGASKLLSTACPSARTSHVPENWFQKLPRLPQRQAHRPPLVLHVPRRQLSRSGLGRTMLCHNTAPRVPLLVCAKRRVDQRAYPGPQRRRRRILQASASYFSSKFGELQQIAAMYGYACHMCKSADPKCICVFVI